jgi:capsular polysaccharide transport system permease protein
MTTGTSKTTAAARAQDIRRARARKWIRRFTLWVVLPTVLAIIYYGLVATPEYESVATFAVKAPGPNLDTEKSCDRDAAVVKDVAQSRDLLNQLDASLHLAAHYENADFLSRLSPGAGEEAMYEYMQEKIRLSAPSSACTFTLTVKAFSAERAEALSREIIRGTGAKMRGLGLSDSDILIIAGPSRPDRAAYPKRGWGVATVAMVALTLLGVLSLMAGAVREHAKF